MADAYQAPGRACAEINAEGIGMTLPTSSAERGNGARRRLLPNLPAAGRLIKRWSDAIDDSWVGDLIGALALFALLWLGLFAALVFGG